MYLLTKHGTGSVEPKTVSVAAIWGIAVGADVVLHWAGCRGGLRGLCGLVVGSGDGTAEEEGCEGESLEVLHFGRVGVCLWFLGMERSAGCLCWALV